MRFSSFYMFQSNIASMNSAQERFQGLALRSDANKKLLTPSDDPAAASQAVTIQSALGKLDQFATARMYAKNTLAQEDQTLTSVTDLLTGNLMQKVVASGNGAYSNDDRKDLATELQGIRDQLMDLANTKSSNGKYIFAGYETDTPPFDEDGNYVGGNTPISQQVSDSTTLQLSHTGDQIFDGLFSTLDKAIAALNTPIDDNGTPPDTQTHDEFNQIMDEVNKSVHGSVDKIGLVHAEVGTNLQQIDQLDAHYDLTAIQLNDTYQQAVGSDYESQIQIYSDYTTAQYTMSASMMVFQAMKGMSIFNFM